LNELKHTQCDAGSSETVPVSELPVQPELLVFCVWGRSYDHIERIITNSQEYENDQFGSHHQFFYDIYARKIHYFFYPFTIIMT
jgi:hypothetical protein